VAIPAQAIGLGLLETCSVAEDGRDGPVRFLGVIPNQPDDIAKMAKRLGKHGELDF
jgi:transposase